MVRLACIGTNFITDWLLEGIREVEGIELSAVYSRTMEKGKEFAAKYGSIKFMIIMKNWQRTLRSMRSMWQALLTAISNIR